MGAGFSGQRWKNGIHTLDSEAAGADELSAATFEEAGTSDSLLTLSFSGSTGLGAAATTSLRVGAAGLIAAAGSFFLALLLLAPIATRSHHAQLVE